MTLEEQLRAFGLPYLAQLLGAELTILTKRGTYAVFWPRQCLRVENGRLVLAHPCEKGLSFLREEIIALHSGVSILPYPGPGHRLYQRVVEHL